MYIHSITITNDDIDVRRVMCAPIYWCVYVYICLSVFVDVEKKFNNCSKTFRIFSQDDIKRLIRFKINLWLIECHLNVIVSCWFAIGIADYHTSGFYFAYAPMIKIAQAQLFELHLKKLRLFCGILYRRIARRRDAKASVCEKVIGHFIPSNRCNLNFIHISNSLNARERTTKWNWFKL